MTNLISNEADFNLDCHLNFAFHFFFNCEFWETDVSASFDLNGTGETKFVAFFQ